ncbi:MAG: hypothetical protein JJT76_03780 [Clostridiaceae bacterium]|nr:hypothetical protein [Clostridiaceae bacterium]
MRVKNRFWGILIAVIILIFISLKATNHIRTIGMSEGKNINIVKEIETDYHNDVAYEKFKKGILQYWGGILYFYDEIGEQKWNIHLGISNPVIRVSKDAVYVMDKGLNQIVALDEGKVKYRYTADGPLSNFKVCDDNYVLLQKTPHRSTTELIVLNQQGSKSSIIKVGEGNIMNIAISQKNDLIAINTLATNSGLESNLLTYDFEGNLLASKSLREQLVLKFSYDGRGNLIVVTDEEIIAINRDNKILWESFIDKTQLFQSLVSDYMVVYSGEEGRNRFIHTGEGKNIKILRYNGQNIGTVKLKEDLQGIDLYEENIIAYSSRTIYLLDKRGNIKMEHKYYSDIEEVLMTSNGSMVIVTKEKVVFIRINGG